MVILIDMKHKFLSHTDYQIFLLKALLWLILAWASFASALGGFFYAPIIWTIFILSGIWLFRRAICEHVNLKPSLEMLVASLGLLAIAISFCWFSVPTVFSGRDQGAISEAAIRLAQNHQLEFSTPASEEFFKIYGPGRALNFPGFYYTNNGKLITQFPLAYITWLGLFYATFGLIGFFIANCILLYIFLLSFYLLTRLFLNFFSALPAILFTVTSFVFMWFSRVTLSENMALPLVWLTILALMLFIRNQRKLHYIIFLASAALLVFTRIEGIAILITLSVVVLYNKGAREYIKSQKLYRLFLPLGIFAVVFAFNFFHDINFYKELAKTIIPNLKPPKAKLLGEIKNVTLPEFYTQKILYLYGLLGFFIVGAIGVFKFLLKKSDQRLAAFFVVLPTLIYLYDSHITPDHPWMLRRFMFSILPVAIFYSGLLIGKMFEKKSDEKYSTLYKTFAGVATLALLAMNMPSFLKYFTFAENKNLANQAHEISKKFTSNDLILLDTKTSGDGWSMLSEPLSALEGKNAVYFFNLKDLTKIDSRKFENIYLLTPNEQVSYYTNSTIGENLTPIDDYTISTSRLDIGQDTPKETVDLPEKKELN